MAVSFSSGVKSEICRNLPQKHCCALSECFGILLFCNTFHGEGIRIITENRDFANLLPKLFRKAFSLNFDSLPDVSVCTSPVVRGATFEKNKTHLGTEKMQHRVKYLLSERYQLSEDFRENPQFIKLLNSIG